MTNVVWVLGKTKYDSYEDFCRDVSDYNTKILGAKSSWNPAQVVADSPIAVVYEAFWKDDDDTIQIIIGELGKALTMGQLLFSLNNATVDFFVDADACFFEGLSRSADGKYELLIGS